MSSNKNKPCLNNNIHLDRGVLGLEQLELLTSDVSVVSVQDDEESADVTDNLRGLEAEPLELEVDPSEVWLETAGEVGLRETGQQAP